MRLFRMINSIAKKLEESVQSKLESYVFKRKQPIKLEKIKSEPTIKIEYENPDEQNTSSSSKKTKWEPANWQEQLGFIKEMRGKRDAPVDVVGCEAISRADPNLTEKEKRFHCLISLMLSSQTRDEITAQAMSQLHTLPLTIDNLLNTDEETLSKLIYPAGFYRRKATYLKKTAKILKEQYDYDIPDSVADMCKLPGVGPKMAYICMSAAWNRPVGIGVDTHVHRIAHRLGWTRTLKSPEHTRKELEAWMPESHWDEINILFVGFGQTICRPIGPKCGECLCRDICPSAAKPKVSKKEKKEKKAK